jgi:hypothetical protein
MIDTLKLSRRLQGAGMERKLAEELAGGLAEGLKERVATRGDLETFHWRTIAAVAGMLLVHFVGVWVLLLNVRP